MTVRSKELLKLGLSLLVSALFLVLAFRNTNLTDLYESLASANYLWLLLMFLCLILSHFLRALRWRYLLNPIKPNIGLRNLFAGVMIGYMMNNILPRAGEIVRPYTIGKLESISKSAALGTIVVERLIDIVTFLLLLVLVPFVYDGSLFDSFPWIEQGSRGLAIATAGLFSLLIILMLRRDWTDVLLKIVRKVLPEKFASRVDGLAHSFLDGFLFLKNPADLVVITVLSAFVWGLYVLMTYVAFHAFHLQSELGMNAALVVLAISSIGIAIPTPGGTGTYHFFTSETLTRLFGIAPSLALSYAAATHAVGLVGVTLIGLYYFLRDNIKVAEAVGAPETRT
ncbi:MAG: lysylphosphatidylglycerol synthase transmembrane domain-containing protein [Bacteroidota bacterium]